MKNSSNYSLLNDCEFHQTNSDCFHKYENNFESIKGKIHDQSTRKKRNFHRSRENSLSILTRNDSKGSGETTEIKQSKIHKGAYSACAKGSNEKTNVIISSKTRGKGNEDLQHKSKLNNLLHITVKKQYLTVKELAALKGVSMWSIYQLLKEPDFPHRKVSKKGMRVDPVEYDHWTKEAAKRESISKRSILTGKELWEGAQK